ncbi:MAG: argininosuccinate lyase [Helicobacteraceae bacterium]|nr:argininosuccinate lyase [Helicobacteraceae bacterium]
MSGKLWGDGSEFSSELLDRFNASINFDRRLYREDIEGSRAHAEMLAAQGIISGEDLEAIKRGLAQVESEIERGEFDFKIADEDIHMAIEARLTAIIGEVGKRLHTARSRNDQVALDLRLWVLRKSREIAGLLRDLIAILLERAEENKSTIMPGFTHLQHAQVVNLAFHLLAYCAMFMRDFERFISSADRNNFSPLGSAALAGTPHKIDREMTARSLGFRGACFNAMDGVSDRDFALEAAFNASVAMTHLSRLCEELILWSSSEFGFIRISDRFTTGSSIMPQKRNPDAAELVRGKTGRVYGNLIALLVTMKSLPLAYNKDMQEDKERVFDALDALAECLTILTAMIADRQTVFNAEAMRRACAKGHLTATDLADSCTKSGVPFREAHHLARRAVNFAMEKGVDLSELTADDLASVDSRLAGFESSLDLTASMNSKSSFGGTSISSVETQIAIVREWLKS